MPAVEEFGFRFLTRARLLFHYADNLAASERCDASAPPPVPGFGGEGVVTCHVGEEPTASASRFHECEPGRISAAREDIAHAFRGRIHQLVG